jgi:hypothetical protein
MPKSLAQKATVLLPSPAILEDSNCKVYQGVLSLKQCFSNCVPQNPELLKTEQGGQGKGRLQAFLPLVALKPLYSSVLCVAVLHMSY